MGLMCAYLSDLLKLQGKENCIFQRPGFKSFEIPSIQKLFFLSENTTKAKYLPSWQIRYNLTFMAEKVLSSSCVATIKGGGNKTTV